MDTEVLVTPRPRRATGGSWRAIFFAPVGDGQTRRRGSDAVRLALSVLVVLLCLVVTRVNSSSETAVVKALTPVPNGIIWLVTTAGWVGSLGLVAVVALLALASKRITVIRDTILSGAGAWLTGILLGFQFGPFAGRPTGSAPHGYDLSFPVARVAATVAVASAAMPYLSRWMQRSIQVTVAVLAVVTVLSEKGLPVAVVASHVDQVAFTKFAFASAQLKT